MSSRRDYLSLICTVFVAVITGLQYFEIRPGGVAMPIELDTVLFSGVLINTAIAGWLTWSLRSTRKAYNAAKLNRLKTECADILRFYRHLNHDYAQEVSYPLSESSLPNFGETWDHHHVEMAKLKSQLDLIVTMAKVLWDSKNWDRDPVKIFSLKQSTKMPDLIEALERFIKIKPQTQTKSQ